MNKFYRFILLTVGKVIPHSTFPILGVLGKKFRYFCAKKIVKSIGEIGNIEPGADLHKDVELGNKTGIGKNCLVSNGTHIGSNVMMGPDCLIYTRNHQFDNQTLKYNGFTDIKKVVIEDDVWIGARVIILPGVTIGKGSTIGAGAVVSKNIPAYSVAVGNPAKVIKQLISSNSVQ